MDMQNISFNLPEFLKQAPCTDWNNYIYNSKNDSIGVEISSVIEQGNLVAIGAGGYSMSISPGIWYSHRTEKWEHTVRKRINASLSPEVFLEVYILNHPNTPIESGFVDTWSGGRCARLLFGAYRSLDYIHTVEYYCWPYSSENKRQVPFHIYAGQSIPQKNQDVPHPFAFIDLDNELIKPVLDSLEFHPLPEEALQVVADNFAQLCHEQSDVFFNKVEKYVSGFPVSDYPDRRKSVLIMRDCGYNVPDPQISVNYYGEIFEIAPYERLASDSRYIPREYQLIEVIYPIHRYAKGRMNYEEFMRREREGGRIYMPGHTVWHVYKIPHEKFSRIKQKLLMLDVVKETEAVIRYFPDIQKKSSFWNDVSYIPLPYEEWYYIPPEHQRFRKNQMDSEIHRIGFGFRYDSELNAHVMDINFSLSGELGYTFITLVDGD